MIDSLFMTDGLALPNNGLCEQVSELIGPVDEPVNANEYEYEFVNNKALDNSGIGYLSYSGTDYGSLVAITPDAPILWGFKASRASSNMGELDILIGTQSESLQVQDFTKVDVVIENENITLTGVGVWDSVEKRYEDGSSFDAWYYELLPYDGQTFNLRMIYGYI